MAGNYSAFEDHATEYTTWQQSLWEKKTKKEDKMKAFVCTQKQKAASGRHVDDNKLRQANNVAEKKLDRIGLYR
jgi:hypothetical protein